MNLKFKRVRSLLGECEKKKVAQIIGSAVRGDRSAAHGEAVQALHVRKLARRVELRNVRDRDRDAVVVGVVCWSSMLRYTSPVAPRHRVATLRLFESGRRRRGRGSTRGARPTRWIQMRHESGSTRRTWRYARTSWRSRARRDKYRRSSRPY